MPRYYAQGAATLCVGRFPEAFGNVHLESQLLGTPAIVSRVAAQRSSLPGDLSWKVDPGDTDAVADALTDIILGSRRCSRNLREFILSEYSIDRMVAGYENVLLNQSPPDLPGTTEAPLSPSPDARLAPWVAQLASGLYHDYRGYCRDQSLLSFLDALQSGCTYNYLISAGMQSHEWENWITEGYVIPAGDGAAGYTSISR
jgi:hypothetical protein